MGRFSEAIKAFDAVNAQDPNKIGNAGAAMPKELVYAQRMSAMLSLIYPDASEALKLAARCQHIRRWEIPRTDYPLGRTGYLAWRNELKRRHSETAGQILRTLGYEQDIVARIGQLLRKEKLKQDIEAQQLEDVVCLVFLEDHLAEFAPKLEEAKIIEIIAKTWLKMSPAGQRAALALDLPAVSRRLVQMALATQSDQHG